MSGPKQDRLLLTRACRANLSQVFGLYPDPQGEVQELLDNAIAGQPPLEATDHLGVRSWMWPLSDEGIAAKVAGLMGPKPVFIADGHHRYETALAYRDERRAAEPGAAPGTRRHDFILFYLCSTRDPGLVVLPTHRLLAEAPPAETLLARWRDQLAVTAYGDPVSLAAAVAAAPSEPDRPRVGVVRRGSAECWLLEAGPGSNAARALGSLDGPLRSLDVSLLHHVVLPGIPADRFSYTHEDAEALRGIGPGGASDLAAFVPPPRIADVLAISRAGLTMPQKSTYFHPKVLTGLAFHELD